jgi:hypothetical protein
MPNRCVIQRRHAAFGIDQNGMNRKPRASEAVTASHRLTKTGGSLAAVGEESEGVARILLDDFTPSPSDSSHALRGLNDTSVWHFV